MWYFRKCVRRGPELRGPYEATRFYQDDCWFGGGLAARDACAAAGDASDRISQQPVPNAAILALLVNPKYPSAESEISETQAAVRSVGCNLIVLNASTESEIDAAFVDLARQHVGGLCVPKTSSDCDAALESLKLAG